MAESMLCGRDVEAGTARTRPAAGGWRGSCCPGRLCCRQGRPCLPGRRTRRAKALKGPGAAQVVKGAGAGTSTLISVLAAEYQCCLLFTR